MKENRIACPRCGQDWLLDVRLTHVDRTAIWCPECDALWLEGAPHSDDFVDYGTFMLRQGRAEPETPDEIEIIGPSQQC